MTPKKQHLDPNVKRDFGVLIKDHINNIRHWLIEPGHLSFCPFSSCIDECASLFPEIYGRNDICPCTILYVSDVKKVAKEAIREWEKRYELP